MLFCIKITFHLMCQTMDKFVLLNLPRYVPRACAETRPLEDSHLRNFISLMISASQCRLELSSLCETLPTYGRMRSFLVYCAPPIQTSGVRPLDRSLGVLRVIQSVVQPPAPNHNLPMDLLAPVCLSPTLKPFVTRCRAKLFNVDGTPAKRERVQCAATLQQGAWNTAHTGVVR